MARRLVLVLCLVTCAVLAAEQKTSQIGSHEPSRLDYVLNEIAAGNATFSHRGHTSHYRSPLELGLIAGAVSVLLLLPPWESHGDRALGNGLAGLSEFVMTRVDKGLEKFPSIPSLDPQECMKRSVCEAHNQPNKYGLLGLALQLLYPPYSAPDEPTTVVSKYQLAARYGRQEDADCSRQYDGCIVSPLEIIQTIVGYFLR
ncbi:hypothetical protein HPB50_008574 [Hyalomma asiaticum]|uniref:Uncharacterized protein n=1 Tax=Hyalomma asiaticum TaxID=266040 RepID=A0ACB7RVK3_HYAAI|nr:hypothetical protein HPB50_008574 [Hyalomma asiaticum]